MTALRDLSSEKIFFGGIFVLAYALAAWLAWQGLKEIEEGLAARSWLKAVATAGKVSYRQEGRTIYTTMVVGKSSIVIPTQYVVTVEDVPITYLVGTDKRATKMTVEDGTYESGEQFPVYVNPTNHDNWRTVRGWPAIGLVLLVVGIASCIALTWGLATF